MKRFNTIMSILLTALSFAQAAEESLDLDAVATPPPATHSAKSLSEFKIMGRMDLTYEYGNPTPNSTPDGKSRNTLQNNHMFIFLKIKASPKTTIMAEVAGQKFFYAEYSGKLANIQLGKILVPFGDNRRYHLFYGGLQGLGVNGVMFPNVWAEPGLNVAWQVPLGTLDTYVVDSIPASSATADPDFQGTSDPSRQAGGLRYTATLISGLNFVASGYSGEYWPGRSLGITGLDLYSDYGLIPFLKSFRFSMGRAEANILSAPVSGKYNKEGDYVELATNLIGPGEARIRYGTYIDNSKVETNKDLHNWNAGYSFQLDAFNVLVEHQWNMEAVNEIDNDLTRIMVSVNF